jgi:hypothetical protein
MHLVIVTTIDLHPSPLLIWDYPFYFRQVWLVINAPVI